MDSEIALALGIETIKSIAAGIITHKIIYQYIPVFLERGLTGRDQCKVCNIFKNIAMSSMVSHDFINFLGE